MISRSPQCYIPSLVKIGSLIPEIFEGFLPTYHIWARWPSWSCDPVATNILSFPLLNEHQVNKFSFPCTQKLTYKIWLKMAQWFLRKANFNSYVNDLWPRARNDLDLKYSLTFIYLISCLYIPIFRPMAAMVSEISTVFPFSYRKSLFYKISPCRKIGQGQPRVII